MTDSDGARVAEDESGLEVLTEHLPAYRDALARAGIVPADIERIVSIVWAGVVACSIHSLDDYQRARLTYEGLRRDLASSGWRPKKAVRLLRLIGEMMRFEQEYHDSHGHLVGAFLWDAAA